LTGRAPNRALRFFTALFLYRDLHYLKRIAGQAAANLKLVLGSLGARYIRVRPYEDFGGIPRGVACERYILGQQPAGLARVNLIPYHVALGEIEGKVVVDAGTNEGLGAALFAAHAREVHAFDRSEEAIATARSRHHAPNLHFQVHDLSRPLPLPDGSVDVVFSSEVVEHLEEGAPFFAAAARALRPGGFLLLKTPNDDYNRLENRLNPHHRNPYTARRLRAELSRHFAEVSVSGMSYEIALTTSTEDRRTPADSQLEPYRFGEAIWIDRVLVVRMSVTPRWVRGSKDGAAEFLWARAGGPRASFASRT
jgi:2-polyprenyl-3-methyl-5-hydroxy-6-metoxy-1,4-benzoquinol methylase